MNLKDRTILMQSLMPLEMINKITISMIHNRNTTESEINILIKHIRHRKLSNIIEKIDVVIVAYCMILAIKNKHKWLLT